MSLKSNTQECAEDKVSSDESNNNYKGESSKEDNEDSLKGTWVICEYDDENKEDIYEKVINVLIETGEDADEAITQMKGIE